jgi:hypothetical protein
LSRQGASYVERPSNRLPGDLPPWWQKVFQACKRVYRRVMKHKTEAQAERAAFHDVRSSYIREAKAAMRGDDRPGRATRSAEAD